jgi:hypothetical protein
VPGHLPLRSNSAVSHTVVKSSSGPAVSRRLNSSSKLRRADDASAPTPADASEGVIVSTRIDYTAEEWGAISTAPHAAQLYVRMANSLAESSAAIEPVLVGQENTAPAAADVPELIRGVVDSIRCGAGRAVVQGGLATDRDKQVLLATIKAAVRAIELRSPVEVEPYKAWLASAAAKALRTSGPRNPLSDRQRSQGQLEEFRPLADVLAVGARQTAHLVPLSRSADSSATRVRRQATAIRRS